MFKLHSTHQQVYVNTAATTPHSDETPLLPNHSRLYLLGCAHRHPYQHTIQRDFVGLKRAMYPVLGHTVYCLDLHLGAETCRSWHLTCSVFNDPFYCILISAFCWGSYFKKWKIFRGSVTGVKLHDARTCSEYSLDVLIHQMEDGNIIESTVNVCFSSTT